LIAHFSVQWHIFLCNGKQENSTDTEENRREDGRERVAGLRTGGSGRQSARDMVERGWPVSRREAAGGNQLWKRYGRERMAGLKTGGSAAALPPACTGTQGMINLQGLSASRIRRRQ